MENDVSDDALAEMVEAGERCLVRRRLRRVATAVGSPAVRWSHAAQLAGSVMERREFRVKRRANESDVAGRRSQATIWFDCPFCGEEVRARVWSMCGGGKRCRCGAMFRRTGEATLK